MTRVADWILNHKRFIVILTVAFLVISLVMMLAVDINYNLADYLPDDTPSSIALQVLKNSFGESVPNLNVFVPVENVPQALEYKAKLSGIDGVSAVLWLDDVADVTLPLEMLDQELVSAWYAAGGALYLVTVDEGRSVEVVEKASSIIGPDGAMSGEAADFSYIQTVTMKEIAQIMAYVVPLVLIVLLFATSSWLEPVLFLVVIGVAIVLNQGTNIFLGEISYVTQACSAVLQLAVSMDYAVFLLHSFARHRQETENVYIAMKKAMVESAPAIAASMLTTLFGFLSLCLMKFKIGPDMGLVLAKGILCSYITVVVLMPVLAVGTTKLLDKTRHRSFLPNFGGFARTVVRICAPVAILVLLLIVPSFLGQNSNEFVYGSSGMHGNDSYVKQESQFISEVFGQNQQMVLLVPEGDVVSEASLSRELEEIPAVTSVTSYASLVGAEIPDAMLDEALLGEFRRGGYSRIILYAATEPEGEEAFAVVEQIRNAAESYYGDSCHLVGLSVINSDMKDTVLGDNLIITIASIVSIGLVLLFTFRNLSIPVILLLTIESAIWINLAIPYFTGSQLNFIGYQIISAVQLGATVDYGILLTQHYLTIRDTMDKKTAVIESLSTAAPSVLTPALIIFAACQMLGIFSTNGVISELGSILGRGALISVAMVLLFLPAMLILFDGVIQKTTLKKRVN
ncbi:MAG TPA: MMPL family transporter [Clostridiales bacterium]|nr:MMPL family transporter [Clostridiales bacterium]